MNQFFSVLVATEELRHSPTINKYAHLHDYVIDVGTLETVSILLPTYIGNKHIRNLRIAYNSDLISIKSTRAKSSRLSMSSVITLILCGRDIGSTTIGLIFANQSINKPPKEIPTISLTAAHTRLA